MTRDTKITIAILVAAVLLVLGLRLAWAQLVYHDMRCVLAECRIVK